jgi:hypothetical protein
MWDMTEKEKPRTISHQNSSEEDRVTLLPTEIKEVADGANSRGGKNKYSILICWTWMSMSLEFSRQI